MNIREIQEAFALSGFNFSESEVEDKLAASNMTAEEVDQELIEVWVEAMQQQQSSQPVKAVKTGGLTKGRAQQPLAKSVPAPPVPTTEAVQAITSVVGTTVEQLVRENYQQEQKAIAAITNYLSGTPTRILQGASERIASASITAPIESVIQQQSDAWADAHLKIEELINSVTAA